MTQSNSPTSLGLYSVRDSLAQEYGPPWLAKNSEVAVRAFRDLMKRDRVTALEDYSLYCIGTFEPRTGLVTNAEGGKPVLVREGSSLLFAGAPPASLPDNTKTKE